MKTNLKTSQEKFNTETDPKLNLIPKNEYRAILRKHLPDEIFQLDKKHVYLYLISLTVYLTSMIGILKINFLPLSILLSVIMGIALGSLTFFLHDLFHGSIIKSKPIEYLFGLSVGILNLFAPSFWHKVHDFHHARTGNVDDPDRSYIKAESPKNLIEKLVYKLRISDESYHPLASLIFMSTGFFWYFFNTMFYGLVGKKASIQEDKKYQRIQDLFKKESDRFFVFFELAVIFAFQAVLFFIVAKSNLITFSLISLLPVGIAHCIAMSYIHTNHFLSPLTGEIDDPLVNSLSLKNSRFVDTIFSNFSHHVEHHLFPAMSSSHYPKVRKLLLELYPERFQLIPMIDAMKMLFKTPRIYGTYTELVSSDGTRYVKCLLPSN
ncbi:MAG: hypothetical protein A3B68_01185 [Candidatus Melainabacteria bacterium RIFCSPHIGHO2_02_FULL_34_12]|nr:MAG: hypothetical protein A3B68_01185 [Candidatus Melainabacteria bacterium RIFCSPHIGHO2_02_FULL_34_12]